MHMGMMTKPGRFWYVINSVLDASGVNAASALLDETITGGTKAD